MAHLYETSIWQGGSGKWYVNDVKDLGGVSGKWWVPARLLGMELTDYVLLLKNDFKVSQMSYNKEKNTLIFSWNNQSDANRYKLWINRMARQSRFMI